MMLCSMTDLRAGVEKLQARLAGPLRLAVAFQRPARHQRDVAQGHVAQVALGEALGVGAVRSHDLHGASGDDDAVEREAAALLAGHRERIRPIGHVVEQTNHRPRAVGGANLQALAGLQFDRDRLGVHGAVLDLDHGGTQARLVVQPLCLAGRIGGLGAQVLLVLAPLRNGGVDGVDAVGCGIVLGHFITRVRQWLEQGPVVFAAAHVGAEGIVVADPDAAFGQLPDGENQRGHAPGPRRSARAGRDSTSHSDRRGSRSRAEPAAARPWSASPVRRWQGSWSSP